MTLIFFTHMDTLRVSFTLENRTKMSSSVCCYVCKTNIKPGFIKFLRPLICHRSLQCQCQYCLSGLSDKPVVLIQPSPILLMVPVIYLLVFSVGQLQTRCIWLGFLLFFVLFFVFLEHLQKKNLQNRTTNCIMMCNLIGVN